MRVQKHKWKVTFHIDFDVLILNLDAKKLHLAVVLVHNSLFLFKLNNIIHPGCIVSGMCISVLCI
jgi:hypothetical protein